MKVRMINLRTVDIARSRVDNIWMTPCEIWYDGAYRDFDSRLRKEFAAAELKENSLIVIRIRDAIGLDKEEQKHLAQFAVNTICQELLLESPRERESRLSATIAAKVNPVILLKMINNKTKIDSFSIQVSINGKQVYKL